MYGLAGLYGAITGSALGLTGGGGAILAVPLLVYGLGVPVHDAITLSLLTVAITAMVGALLRASEGLVEYKTGLAFAATGMVGAPLGGWLGARTPETALMLGFTVLLVGMGAKMYFDSRKGVAMPVPAAPLGPLRQGLLVAGAGLSTGLLSGFFGVGGGFLIVPAMIYAAKLPMHRAASTSLMVIALVSGTGFGAAVLRGQYLGSETTLPFLAGALTGLLLGSMGARRLAPQHLQRIFAVGLFVVAGFIAWKLSA